MADSPFVIATRQEKAEEEGRDDYKEEEQEEEEDGKSTTVAAAVAAPMTAEADPIALDPTQESYTGMAYKEEDTVYLVCYRVVGAFDMPPDFSLVLELPGTIFLSSNTNTVVKIYWRIEPSRNTKKHALRHRFEHITTDIIIKGHACVLDDWQPTSLYHQANATAYWCSLPFGKLVLPVTRIKSFFYETHPQLKEEIQQGSSAQRGKSKADGGCETVSCTTM